MKETIKKAVIIVLVFTVLCGIIYPLFMTAIAQLFFSETANGSILVSDGKKIGSEKIGQAFQKEKYFWGRPSASQYQYSAATNKGVKNESLLQQRQQLTQALQNTTGQEQVPIDLITFSASGLDPEISQEAALYQVERIATVRNLPKEKIESLIQDNLSSIGPKRVNVLKLNLALDQLQS